VFSLSVTDAGGQSASDEVTVTLIDTPPTVNAGEDGVVVAGSSVLLSGSASDLDGPLAYVGWTQLSGPEVTLQAGATAEEVSFIAPYANATAIFELTAIDGAAQESREQVVISPSPIRQGSRQAPPSR